MKYSRMDQVIFVEDSLQKIWRDMVCLRRPYPFKYFKGRLPQILLGLFLNTLSQMKHSSHTKHILQHILKLQPPEDGKCYGITHSLKKKYSLETCARLLFMLLQDFFASTRPHRVDKVFFYRRVQCIICIT